MRIRLVGTALLTAAMGAIAPLTTAAPAGASPGCGSTITTDTVLQADIGPCPSGGLVIGAHLVTLDLNGHRIFGTPGEGDGFGIILFFRQGVTIKGGTVSGFDTGIGVIDGSFVTLADLSVTDNVSAGGAGIVLGGQRHTVRRSHIARNGTSAGIYVVGGGTAGTSIVSNVVADNSVAFEDSQRDIGVYIQHGSGTEVVGNTIARNGFDGVGLGPGARDSFILRNTVVGNGFHSFAHRSGDGIQVGPENFLLDRRTPAQNNRIEGNVVRNNAGNGIVATAPTSRIIGNIARGNGAAPHTGSDSYGAFDLHDRLAACASNVWTGNTFGTASPACAAAP